MTLWLSEDEASVVGVGVVGGGKENMRPTDESTLEGLYLKNKGLGFAPGRSKHANPSALI